MSVSVNLSEPSVAAQGASWDINTDRFSLGPWTQYCRAFNHIRYRTERRPNPGAAEVTYLSHYLALHLSVCSSSALLFPLTHWLTNHSAFPGPLNYLSPRLKIHMSTLVGLNRCLNTFIKPNTRVLKQDHIQVWALKWVFYPPTSPTYPVSNPFTVYHLFQLAVIIPLYFLTDDLVLSGNWGRLRRETMTWNKK